MHARIAVGLAALAFGSASAAPGDFAARIGSPGAGAGQLDRPWGVAVGFDGSLIREGNAAPAISLSGTMLGFAVPVANVIRNSRGLLDLVVWSAIACTVQLLTYLVARRVVPKLPEDITAGKAAPALFLAALSLSVGLINAACMEY